VQRGRNLFVARYYPALGDVTAIDDAARAFLAEVDQMFTSFVET
jgi:hypothetical protein